MDSKDLLSLLKEPLFFDDWVAANFKAINLPSDWLAAQQSPYQILGGDPEALRLRAGRARGVRPGARVGRAPVHRASAGEGLGGPSVLPWGLHASAAPCSAANRRQTVAMAAVAVLRNDSLQAFLQVRAGLGGGEGKVGGAGLDFPRYSAYPESQKDPCAVDVAGVRLSGGAHANFAPNLGVKSVALGGGTRGSGGGGMGVPLAENKALADPDGPPC